MQNQLYPANLSNNTIEAYLPKVSIKSQLIYTFILSMILGALAALPFIYVDVSVKSSGLSQIPH